MKKFKQRFDEATLSKLFKNVSLNVLISNIFYIFSGCLHSNCLTKSHAKRQKQILFKKALKYMSSEKII